MVVVDWFKKLVDIVIPIENDEYEEEVAEKKVEAKPAQATATAATANATAQTQQQQTQAQNLMETMAERRTVAAGGGAATSTVNTGVNYASYKDTVSRPNLKLIKAPEFVMKLYQPTDYSQIVAIADDILAHKAAVVNYEFVHAEEQRRISDYIDGVCYAVDGTVTQISEKISLYVPAGINTSDIAALVASVRYH